MALEFISFDRNNEMVFKNITAEYFLKKIETIDCHDIKIELPSKMNTQITSKSSLKEIRIGENFNFV